MTRPAFGIELIIEMWIWVRHYGSKSSWKYTGDRPGFYEGTMKYVEVVSWHRII